MLLFNANILICMLWARVWRACPKSFPSSVCLESHRVHYEGPCSLDGLWRRSYLAGEAQIAGGDLFRIQGLGEQNFCLVHGVPYRISPTKAISAGHICSVVESGLSLTSGEYMYLGLVCMTLHLSCAEVALGLYVVLKPSLREGITTILHAQPQNEARENRGCEGLIDIHDSLPVAWTEEL